MAQSDLAKLRGPTCKNQTHPSVTALDGIGPNLAAWPRHSSCARSSGKTEHDSTLVAKLSIWRLLVANK